MSIDPKYVNQVINDRIVGAFLDDEPQGHGKLFCQTGSILRWNGIPVRVELMHYEWQDEREYFLFMYRDTNLSLISN